LIVVAAIIRGRTEETPMSDNPTISSPPAFTLASPGFGTTDDPEAMESSHGTYSVELGPYGRLHTVEWLPGHHSEEPPLRPADPVDWAATIPSGAHVFSVTAGVSAARVRQFWVGWLSGGRVHMEPLDGVGTLSSSFVPDESMAFPAVMDGSGAASVYTWRPTASGSALWQRVFSKWTVDEPVQVVEISGRPAVSRVTSGEGLRTRHAVVAWVESTGAGAVLGMVAAEEGRRTKVLRSQPVPGTEPFLPQRLGVWASSALDAFEVAAVLTRADSKRGYEIARFQVTPERPQGRLGRDVLDLAADQLARAAIDHGRGGETPHTNQALLLRDGRLLANDGRLVHRSVRLDSELPIVMVGWGAYWRVAKRDGSFELEDF